MGIGYSYSKKLEYLNLFTLQDLINHYPFRYDDFSAIKPAINAQIGEKVTLQGEIWSIQNIYTRSRKIITKAIFNDGTSPIELTWFNSSWLTKQIQTGDRLQVSGKLTKYKNKLSIMAPVWEPITSEESKPTSEVTDNAHLRGEMLHTGRLVPVYPETYGVSSKWLRTKIAKLLPEVLGQIKDPLPDEIKSNMLTLPNALQKIHFPKNWEDMEKARERLSFDELFYIQLVSLKTRAAWQKKQVIDPLKIDQKKLDQFIKKIPFKLTKAQEKVLEEIFLDLQG